jgi:hypothetical protein
MECPVDDIISNETNFFNWLKGDKKCPSAAAVQAALHHIGSGADNSTGISNSNQQIQTLTKQLEQRKLDIQVAKDRAAMVARPEMTASYYDGWFPLNRPMKNSNVPIMICVSTFLFVFAVLMILDLVGLKLRFPVPKFQTTSKSNSPLWIMTIVAGVACIGVVYLYFKKT